MIHKQFQTDTNIKSALFTFLKAWCGYIVTSQVLGYFPGDMAGNKKYQQKSVSILKTFLYLKLN